MPPLLNTIHHHVNIFDIISFATHASVSGALNGFNDSQGALINIEPQSLNSPNIVLQDYSFEEEDGDGDLVANPGESINL